MNEIRKIPLRPGVVAIVDEEDFERINAHKWCLLFSEGKGYATRKSPAVNGNRKTIRMHREVLKAPDGVIVDHINGDGLDNRKTNLRLCDLSQNGANRRHHRKALSGYKGVSWNKAAETWHVMVRYKGQLIPLGTYGDLKEAIAVYNRAVTDLHGEFAALNELPEKKVALAALEH